VKQVMLFTDGSCLRNPGPGGWAGLLRCGWAQKELAGSEADTTNNTDGTAGRNRRPCRPQVHHLVRWIAAGWRSSRGAPIANRDLWERLVQESTGTR